MSTAFTSIIMTCRLHTLYKMGAIELFKCIVIRMKNLQIMLGRLSAVFHPINQCFDDRCGVCVWHVFALCISSWKIDCMEFIIINIQIYKCVCIARFTLKVSKKLDNNRLPYVIRIGWWIKSVLYLSEHHFDLK